MNDSSLSSTSSSLSFKDFHINLPLSIGRTAERLQFHCVGCSESELLSLIQRTDLCQGNPSWPAVDTSVCVLTVSKNA